MADRPLFRLVEFRGGPLDDQTHLLPISKARSEEGTIEVVVDVGRIRVCCYAWTDLKGGGAVVYDFDGYRED